MFIDTHCHIDDDKLSDKRAVVDNFIRDGVDIAVNAGCNVATSENGKSLAERFENVYFMAGFHPSDALDFTDSARARIERLCYHEKCVAVGEIGLDYHWNTSDKELQKQVFVSQIELADKVGLPVSVHCRDATADVLEILKSHTPKYGGVMHCFSGSAETAKELLKLGFYISFSGTLTFKNARNLPEIAAVLPFDAILTETDSPYLAPVPFRGSVNETKNVSLVTARLAEIRGESIEKTARQVLENAKRLFKKL